MRHHNHHRYEKHRDTFPWLRNMLAAALVMVIGAAYWSVSGGSQQEDNEVIDETFLRGASSKELAANDIKKDTMRRKLQEAPTNTIFAPITDLTIVYDETDCPEGFSRLMQDLNSGTNGRAVHLCYNRGYASQPITEIQFRTSWWSSPTCSSGFDPVLQHGTSTSADLNEGATGTFLWMDNRLWITMCYRTGTNNCDDQGECDAIYQLRPLLGILSRAPRLFTSLDQNVNEGVGGDVAFLAYSKSPSFMAGALAVADGDKPYSTAAWSKATETPDGDIQIELSFDFHRDGGSDAFNMCWGSVPIGSQDEFERYCDLVRDGIEEYWSGPVTIQGVTRNIIVTTTIDEEDEERKEVDICLRDCESLDFVECLSSTPGIPDNNNDVLGNVVDMTMWYKKGMIEGVEVEEATFKRIAAHEIGHSFLADYGGLIYSWDHKGTTVLMQADPDVTPECPDVEDGVILDAMSGYFGWCWFDVANYAVTVDNWDRASMLITVGEYINQGTK